MESGAKSKEDALEKLRKGIVSGMTHGKHFVINVDKYKPQLKGETFKGSSDVSVDTVFNFEEFHKEEVNKEIATEGENVNQMGDEGQFFMMATFSMCFLAKYTSDEDCQALLDAIPHSDQMLQFVIS